MSKNHEKFKKTMKIAGLTMLAIGIVFIVIGAVDFAHAFGGEDGPKKFWVFFVGFPLFAFGAMCTMIGFHREIVQYMKDETMPVTKEAAKEIKAALTEDDGANQSNGGAASARNSASPASAANAASEQKEEEKK